ncbi:hypothetical protein QYM36_007953 [Artemia franciscana]|uniref:Endonuclease/exonuclease/phosphatase domain-containing protein n=1 Tax=Artemia franciscana TaxID=6661 RepID=A0AA88IH93_ARTSF|nr:hypothetical protein QYM36_007953 [Artemia franciscana]
MYLLEKLFLKRNKSDDKLVLTLQNFGTNFKKMNLTEIRQWENATDFPKLKENQESQSLDLSIMSYNVLAQQYLATMPYLYYKCIRENFKWPVIKQRLLNQFEEFNTDIVCLQEVEADHYYKT